MTVTSCLTFALWDCSHHLWLTLLDCAREHFHSYCDIVHRSFWISYSTFKLPSWFICYYLDQIYTSLCTQGVLRVRKRVTLMGVTVTAIFGICWTPDIIAHLIKHFTSVSVSEAAFAVIHTLILFSSAVNPFMYALVNKTFREKLTGMLCCSCICSTGTTRNRDCQQNVTSTAGTSSPEWSKNLKHFFFSEVDLGFFSGGVRH